MTPTLDTAAIRARFDKAVIGIRADGTMAVLMPGEIVYGPMPYFDLATGTSYALPYNYAEQKLTSDTFPTLIRPGDECEVSGDGVDWEKGIFITIIAPFDSDDGCFVVRWLTHISSPHSPETAPFIVAHIRPLPAPEPSPTREQKAVELVKELAAIVRSRRMWDGSEKTRQILEIAIEAAALFGEEEGRG